MPGAEHFPSYAAAVLPRPAAQAVRCSAAFALMEEDWQGENAAALEGPRVDGLGLPEPAAAGGCIWIQPVAEQ
jgi:hypothetical protein